MSESEIQQATLGSLLDELAAFDRDLSVKSASLKLTTAKGTSIEYRYPQGPTLRRGGETR